MAKDDSLWDEVKEMRDRLNRMFRDFDINRSMRYSDKGVSRWWGFGKEVSFNETPKEFIITIELPGMRKEDICVNPTANGIEVRTERKQKSEKREKEEYEYRRSYAGYYRHISLPSNADLDKIDAKYEDGLLTISVPKSLRAVTRKEVKIK